MGELAAEELSVSSALHPSSFDSSTVRLVQFEKRRRVVRIRIRGGALLRFLYLVRKE